MKTGAVETRSDTAAKVWAAFDRLRLVREQLEDAAEALAAAGNPAAPDVLAASRDVGRGTGRIIRALAG